MKTILVLLALVSLTIALEKCSNYQCPPQCDNTDDKVCALHESGFLNTYLNPCKACCESGAQTYSCNLKYFQYHSCFACQSAHSHFNYQI